MTPKQKSMVAMVLVIRCVCIAFGVVDGVIQTRAQSTSYTEAYGSLSECTSCHLRVSRDFETTAHGLSMFTPDDTPSAVVADFAVGETIRLFQFANEDAPRVFTLEDVAMVIGSGRHAQSYATRLDDGTYQLLPAEWVVEAQEWQPLSVSLDTRFEETCATCHTTGYDAYSLQWVDEAVTCEVCHGGGMTHIELADDAGSRIDDEEEEAILSAIIGAPSAEACASCHSSSDLVDDAIHENAFGYETWLGSPHSQPDETGEILSCDGCHLPHGDGTLNSLTSEIKADGCFACHDDFSTPLIAGETIIDRVNGVASAHYEANVTCESCHSEHVITDFSEHLSITGNCLDCHDDTTAMALRDFMEGAQTSFAKRLAIIEDATTSTSPHWIQTVLTTIELDGSQGLHNVRYTSQLLDAVEIELGLQQAIASNHLPIVTASDPQDCAECHSEIHTTWQSSYHANASLSDSFQTLYAENGQPSYCMSCHASGYDPATQDYVFEGVVCSSCHIVDANVEHPPAPIPLAKASSECGRCHSGEHAPQYSEWLVSDHSDFNVDCVDCHTPHDNRLRLDDINATCADCHEDAMNDEIHMGADMTCVDCHMSRESDTGTTIHHTMQTDPSTCDTCHGDIHSLQSDPTRQLSDADRELFITLEDEMQTLEEKANTNLQSGIVGGAVGSLVLVIFLFIAVRLGRIR